MADTLRDRALKIAEFPWAYASSDIAAVIQELLARLAATSSLPPHSRSADLSRPQNTSIS